MAEPGTAYKRSVYCKYLRTVIIQRSVPDDIPNNLPSVPKQVTYYLVSSLSLFSSLRLYSPLDLSSFFKFLNPIQSR
jgi:hypothetical protein